jgi:hypothetical protein
MFSYYRASPSLLIKEISRIGIQLEAEGCYWANSVHPLIILAFKQWHRPPLRVNYLDYGHHFTTSPLLSLPESIKM